MTGITSTPLFQHTVKLDKKGCFCLCSFSRKPILWLHLSHMVEAMLWHGHVWLPVEPGHFYWCDYSWKYQGESLGWQDCVVLRLNQNATEISKWFIGSHPNRASFKLLKMELNCRQLKVPAVKAWQSISREERQHWVMCMGNKPQAVNGIFIQILKTIPRI